MLGDGFGKWPEVAPMWQNMQASHGNPRQKAAALGMDGNHLKTEYYIYEYTPSKRNLKLVRQR